MTPIPVKKTKFIDIDINFNAHPVTGDVTKRIDVNAIITSLKSLVMTRRYDRKFHPEIESQVMDQLFELMTLETISALKRTLQYVIENFEPRVSIVSIDVREADDNKLEVTLIFNVVGVVETLKTQFYLDRTL